jgi:hypothetical protein
LQDCETARRIRDIWNTGIVGHSRALACDLSHILFDYFSQMWIVGRFVIPPTFIDIIKRAFSEKKLGQFRRAGQCAVFE